MAAIARVLGVSLAAWSAAALAAPLATHLAAPPAVVPPVADQHPGVAAKVAASGKVDVAIVGDSMAAMWPTGAFTGRRVADLGVGGDRTQKVIYWLQRYDLAHLAPSIAIMIVGTNNLTVHEKPEAIASGITEIARMLHRAWPAARVVVLGIPRRDNRGYNFEPDRRAVNALVSNAARGERFEFVDNDAALACEGCGYFRPDGVHLTGAGYAKLMEIIPGG